ncbi:hypothetical protein [Occultella gossypii]|uniref:Uncharacterized protein n=1 Tax=Occultella gossypii TaxID=2800820 RepID=A0ABS7S7B2_9MICO|nr:hypothetical protein [Occultella gossypii]MBZ2195972.1 hypothetical protein [Occultella gossypii]
MKLPWLRDQPDAPETLNPRDAEHTERVVTRRDLTGEAEVVYARPEAADHWREDVWRPNP